MKKITVIGLLFIHFAFASHSQSVYSKQNLEKASPEVLKVYLEQVKSQKSTGKILCIAVPVLVITAYTLMNNSTMDFDTGWAMFILGTITTIVGIPILIVGSTRVNRIKHTLSDRVLIEMAPCRFQYPLTQNHQTGVTLRIRF